MEIEESEIYDLLYDNSFSISNREYGMIDVVEVNDFVEDVFPRIISYINDNLREEKIEIIS